ncbi:MAG TPA: phosphoribosyltransferase family protein [Candidatus Saccharimonadales bacterium]|nr:phosphoribosyltransferase family protein [Candidatus Saccharimonadales bacterium]
MREEKIIQILKKIDALVVNDHFVYTSGKHGSAYIRKDKLYPFTKLTSKVCKMIAEQVKDWGIEIVVGPSVGGIVLSQWTAYHLSHITKKEVLSVFTEKSYDDVAIYDLQQKFKRGYDALVKGKRALVVEDLTNTGDSVKKVVEQVKNAGGTVVGVYVLVNRNPLDVHSEKMGAPFHSLGVFRAEAWDEKDCPLCKKGIPVNTTVGHGKEFLGKITENE